MWIKTTLLAFPYNYEKKISPCDAVYSNKEKLDKKMIPNDNFRKQKRLQKCFIAKTL